jgi:hypothetical protein
MCLAGSSENSATCYCHTGVYNLVPRYCTILFGIIFVPLKDEVSKRSDITKTKKEGLEGR